MTFLNTSETANYLKITRSQFMALYKKAPTIRNRSGRKGFYLFDRHDVDQWASKGLIKATLATMRKD